MRIAWKTSTESCREVLIDLDGHNFAPSLHKKVGEGAFARTDFNHEIVGIHRYCCRHAFAVTSIREEVLSELWRPASWPRHDKSSVLWATRCSAPKGLKPSL